jgi:hypothetical protein
LVIAVGLGLGLYLVWSAMTGVLHVRCMGVRGLTPMYRVDDPLQFWWLFLGACVIDAFLFASVIFHR